MSLHEAIDDNCTVTLIQVTDSDDGRNHKS